MVTRCGAWVTIVGNIKCTHVNKWPLIETGLLVMRSSTKFRDDRKISSVFLARISR